MLRPPHSNRRGFLATSSITAAAWFSGKGRLCQASFPGATVPAVIAQGRAAAATARVQVTKLRGNVYLLTGSGGNIAVLTGKDGKLLIDSGFSTSQQQITAALDAISSEPIRHLINTHWHFDHTDGNQWLHGAGATIRAQQNTEKRLATTQMMSAFDAVIPPAPKDALPTQTFTDHQSLTLNGERLSLRHYQPAHTDSDISIHLAEANVLHVGDTWFNGFYPFIDYSSGGQINGMIAAAERSVAVADAKTIIIPGHGSTGGRADLIEYREMLVYARDRVAAMKREGTPLAEIVAARPTAAYDDKWGKGFFKPDRFLALVYQGV